MYGWIHTCLEKLILNRYGEDTWAQIKDEARCEVENGDWIRYENYKDADTFALVGAVSKVLNLDMDTVLEVFGVYFIQYVREEGYSNMLSVLGSDLREWLTNVNDLHAHLKSSLPDAIFPEFWCVDDDEPDPDHESMLLHYYSQRGTVLSALNVGVVKEVARYFFQLKIRMIRIASQDENDSQFTTWRVILLGPYDDDEEEDTITAAAAAAYNKEEEDIKSSLLNDIQSVDGDKKRRDTDSSREDVEVDSSRAYGESSSSSRAGGKCPFGYS